MKHAALALAAIIGLSAPAAASQDHEQHALHVRFLAGSDQLTNIGKAQLDEFAREFRTLRDRSVSISGFATLAESEENSSSFAIGFSQRRAANVRSYLVTRGVPDNVMTTLAFGASRTIEGTAPAAAANQRVEVQVTEGSGW